ncbi:MAG: hypothetical protein IJN53_06500 [Oscillospiraceae bacterium]|nr:hypothetical protein [Oscillospiraceae bacterium]
MKKAPISEDSLMKAIEQADRALLEEIIDAAICAYSRMYPCYDFYFCREERSGNRRKRAKSEAGKTLQFRQHCGIVDYRKILLEARNCEAEDA